jgi:hypothetical protein
MSAAAIAVPAAEASERDAAPVPLYTRHMLGAIEAARDRRVEDRHRTVPRGRFEPHAFALPVAA